VGGAVFIHDGGVVVIDKCVFERNRADRGGAIRLRAPSSAYIHNCEFVENEAFDVGAAVSGDNVTGVEMSWCLIRDSLGGGAFGLWYGGIQLYNCTVVGNDGGAFLGEDGGWGGYTLEQTIAAFNDGPAFEDNSELHAYVSCTDMYGNSGGNWTAAPVSGQLYQDGNLQMDPQFCGYGSEDYTLDASSPCAPYSPPNPECGLIGACSVECGGVAVQEWSWSDVKALYDSD